MRSQGKKLTRAELKARIQYPETTDLSERLKGLERATSRVKTTVRIDVVKALRGRY